MTREDLEKPAIGIETGYTDRNGIPIRVGDKIVLYHRCTASVGSEEIKEWHEDYWVGCGAQGYVYTGKIQRQNHQVKFSFYGGLEMTQSHKWKFLRELDSKGNLKFVLVNNNGKAPKMTYEELMKEVGHDG
jgi:hypothetical protein